MKNLTTALILAVSIVSTLSIQAQANCSMSTTSIATCEFGELHYAKTVTLTNNSACGLDSIWYQYSGTEAQTEGAVDHGTYTVYRFDSLRLVISNKSLEDLSNGSSNSVQTSRMASVYHTNEGSNKLTSLGMVKCESISAN